MRWVVVILIWLAPLFVRLAVGDLVGVYAIGLIIAFAHWNAKRGGKWYRVLQMLVPIYGLWVIGEMYWDWAGEIAGRDEDVPKMYTPFELEAQSKNLEAQAEKQRKEAKI
jgi:hypothetical protein